MSKVMTGVIIITIVLVIAFLLFIPKNNKKSIGNPIETINFVGCMGINLGDPWKFVLSRMLHLNLISKKKFREYHMDYERYLGDSFMEVGVGSFSSEEHFNNIQELEFVIRYGILNHVFIKFAGEQHDIDTIVDIVKNKITRRFGNPMENKKDGNHFFMWMDRETGNMLILSDVDHSLTLSSGIL